MTDIRAPRTPAEFRRFVLAHHPDRGGDAGVFAAGVAAYRGQRTGNVVFYRRRRARDLHGRALRRLLRLWPGARRRPHDRRPRR